VNLLVGVVGSVLGGWMFGLLGIATTGLLGSLVTSVVGAIVLLWIVSLFNNRKKIEL
uniref:GlsB/YeaQ/YmgE family stress response membrane protein n=1 Tax=uncultured Bacteroides sp. TaxID=162156 RepID=UPI002635F952